jgi:anthranilate phosphoribosyltransferase
MTPDVAEALKIVAARKPLSRELAERVFLDLMDGKATEAQKGAILLGIATRGETAEEVAGAVSALRARMRRVSSRRSPLLDTCGPGGIGRDFFNLSTAAAVVAAGAGASVAKHGNRAISSRVGSADVLSACGVTIDLDPETAGRLLDDVGLAFLFAPAFHPAMKELGTVRRELGVRTIFNALGPLANPASASRQLIGVGRPELVRLLADALAALGAERAIVFHSSDGYDELIPGIPAAGVEVHEGWTRPWTLEPGGVPQRAVDARELAGGDARENAQMLERLLDGEAGARRETVLLNVAVALTVEGSAESVTDGYERARAAIDSGAARARFDALRSWSRPKTGTEA